jgi:5'-methylthioadenosine phosphorylase
MPDIGIIVGSGFGEIEGTMEKRSEKISTPYGDPSDAYRIYEISGVEAAFLARHGSLHHIPPHKINYRANLWGFRELGAKRILSVSAAGGISTGVIPGDIVVPDQVIDMTSCRTSTFFEGADAVHIDFTSPYCKDLRELLLRAGKRSSIELKDGATYICVNGPRLETRAEIRFFASIGADIVGMTAMPEASLARELELCFGLISVVTNYAAGISGKPLTVTEVIEVMKRSKGSIWRILERLLQMLPAHRDCECSKALKEARM